MRRCKLLPRGRNLIFFSRLVLPFALDFLPFCFKSSHMTDCALPPHHVVICLAFLSWGSTHTGPHCPIVCWTISMPSKLCLFFLFSAFFRVPGCLASPAWQKRSPRTRACFHTTNPNPAPRIYEPQTVLECCQCFFSPSGNLDLCVFLRSTWILHAPLLDHIYCTLARSSPPGP